MNFGYDIERHTPEEQQAWAMFVGFELFLQLLGELIFTPNLIEDG